MSALIWDRPERQNDVTLVRDRTRMNRHKGRNRPGYFERWGALNA